jgi:hypothetical protein
MRYHHWITVVLTLGISSPAILIAREATQPSIASAIHCEVSGDFDGPTSKFEETMRCEAAVKAASLSVGGDRIDHVEMRIHVEQKQKYVAACGEEDGFTTNKGKPTMKLLGCA